MIHYKVLYKVGSRKPVLIAYFYKGSDGNFVFEYDKFAQYEFPGFRKGRTYKSRTLWGSIAFRVPNSVREAHRGANPELLLSITKGRLVTDNFEFILT